MTLLGINNFKVPESSSQLSDLTQDSNQLEIDESLSQLSDLTQDSNQLDVTLSPFSCGPGCQTIH